MNDENKPPFPAPEPDPEEVRAIQDIFNSTPEESGGDDIFSQDIFSAPPPPPPGPQPSSPHPPQPANPEPLSPPPPPEPAPPPAVENEQDVKVVGFDDFDNLAQPQGLSVEGQSFAPDNAAPPARQELAENDENMPELAMAGEPSPPPAQSVEDASDFGEAQAVTEDEWANEDIGIAEAVEETGPTPVEADEELTIRTEKQPLTLKAAKAKEGPEAVEQTRELIERLDGADGDFLDAAEIKRAVKSISGLKEEVRRLAERVKALEERLK